MESPAWKIKLKKKLSEQFEEPALKSCLERFTDNLTQEKSELSQKPAKLADFLVDGDFDKHEQIVLFLDAISEIQPYAEHRVFLDKIQDAFALLLQTLVRKNEDGNHQGFTVLPVKNRSSVETIGASRNSIPHLPELPEFKEEFENGKRDRNLKVTGVFFPEEGGLNCKSICETIARELLSNLRNINGDITDPINKLNGHLNSYPLHKKPLEVVYINPGKQSEIESMIAVTEKLHTYLREKVWFYIYGEEAHTRLQQTSDDWLHSTEDDLWGLLSNFDEYRQIKRLKEKEDKTLNKIKQNNSGQSRDNYQAETINIIQFNVDQTQLNQLKGQIKETREIAGNAKDVGKAEFLALNQALDIIEKQVDNPTAVDQTALEKSQETLSGLVDISSLAVNIQTILNYFT